RRSPAGSADPGTGPRTRPRTHSRRAEARASSTAACRPGAGPVTTSGAGRPGSGGTSALIAQSLSLFLLLFYVENGAAVVTAPRIARPALRPVPPRRAVPGV